MSVWYCELLRAATDPSDQRVGGLRFQHVPVKHPGTFGQRMRRVDFAALDGKAECSGTDAEPVSGLGQIHPSL